MDARVMKLTKHYSLSEEDAKTLVDAGFTTPKRIKAASDDDLRALNVNVSTIRTLIRL